MRTCPTCEREVSDRAKVCPGCGEDFIELKKEKTEKDAEKIFLVGLIIAAFVLVILSPGIALNWMMGRLKTSPDGFIWASVKDWLTWLVSLFTWGCVAFLVYGKKSQNKSQKNSRRSAQADMQKPVETSVGVLVVLLLLIVAIFAAACLGAFDRLFK